MWASISVITRGDRTKKLLNTLYVTRPDSYITRDGSNIVVNFDGKEIGRLPIHNVEQIVCFGYPGASPSAMGLCVDSGVGMCFMTPNGRFIASIRGETNGNVLLRREQYRIADDGGRSVQISRNMILGKMVNSRAILRKFKNNHPESNHAADVDRVISKLTELIGRVSSIDNSVSLRVLESEAAKCYFGVFDAMILKNKDSFFFRERNRRPPRDRINAMLSFLYAMLANDVRSALESVGLDPFVGFLHTDRPGRPSLALDIMEEMRPIADRVVLSIVNLRVVDPEGFVEKEGGSILMKDETRKLVISAWQNRKNDEVYHPYIEEKIKIGLIPFVQSSLLAKCVRGEINGYPPFILGVMKNDASSDL